MKWNLPTLASLAALCVPAPLGFAAAPSLSIQQLPSGQLQIIWPGDAAGFSLEQADNLNLPVPWRTVSEAAANIAGSFSVTIPMANQTRFYRLRGGLLTTILETSPANGESGVAVTRETIFRLSAPLASDATVTTSQLFAEFGGRRLLARAELSGDRKTATLFYLENLPASARVSVTFNGTGLNDASGTALDADGDSQPGGVFQLSFTTSGVTGLPGTAVIGHVFASEKNADGSNKPLSNVTITVDGAEETLRATTDATGLFKLQPAPAGRFFVLVDGRTAQGSQWPGGAYYPFVGKAWDAVPGRTNNLAGGSGEIFLPLIQADALKTVSATEETKITFVPSVLAANPALAGVEIMVPPNSLFSDNGTRGGKVGIAPVPPDRLPEPLPPGLNFPLVITIQTDGGSNFDVPVPVRFPNLPDPVTGVKLAPGEKTVLWSFNHDTGRWEAQGTMTISADGNFAVTDPGVGVRQPGWHGVGPGSPCGGPGGGGGGPQPCSGPDCECTQTILCTIPHEGKNYLTCMIECLGNPLKQIFGNNKTVTSPIQSGLRCIGGPDLCPGRPDDVLTKEQRKCMDACRYPDSDYIWYVVPCEGFTYPCPASASVQSLSVSPHLSPTNPLPDRLEEQSYFWKVEEDYLVRLTGTPKIVEMTVEELPILYAMFDLFSSYVRTGSLAGIHLSAGERAELVGLPRPSQFTQAEWGAMIDRLDSFQGSALPADVAAAEKKLEDTITLFKSRGWQYRLDGFVQGHLRLSRARAPLLGSSQFPAQAHYFYLENHNTGFIQRGRLSRSGTFEGLILAPDNYFTVAYYDPVTRYAGAAFFKSSANGLTTLIPTAPLEPLPTNSLETDGDRLPDVAELVIGTNSTRSDTDGDGVGDFQELFANTNPLDGVVASVGVIAALDTPGNAVDVTAWNDLAAVADSAAGVALFNVVNPQAPVLLAQLDTPGSAVSVAGSGQRLAVADTRRSRRERHSLWSLFDRVARAEPRNLPGQQG